MTASRTINPLFGLQADLRAVLNRRVLLRNIKKSALILNREMVRSTKKNLRKKPTGQLAQSWKPFVKAGGSASTKIKVGSSNAMPYANIHNEGDDIHAENQFLAIPLHSDAENRGWPRDWPDGELRFGITKKGTPVLFTPTVKQGGRKSRTRPKRKGRTKRGRASELNTSPVYGRPMFWLTPSVTIKPTHYIDKGLAKAAEIVAQLWVDSLGNLGKTK